MKDIDLNTVTSKDLINYTALSEAFKNYLIKVLGYEEYEADFVVSSDFASPYDTPYIINEYEGIFVVDEKKYQVMSCHTDFCACGMFHLANVPPFEFYMFIDTETLSDSTVGAYREAKKMYLL